jgi:hypothetical protein
VSSLADWLCLSVGELEWYADLRGLNHKTHNPKCSTITTGFCPSDPAASLC